MTSDDLVGCSRLSKGVRHIDSKMLKTVLSIFSKLVFMEMIAYCSRVVNWRLLASSMNQCALYTSGY